MKKNIILIILGFYSSFIYSQDISDALRFSQDNLNGTARYRAMSGAFGALGGDFSSLNVNPAGSAIFSNNQIALTFNNYGIKNKSNYFGTSVDENSSSFDLNQAGGVYVFKNEDTKSDWKKFSIALNYENANNFNNSIFSAGTNTSNSIGDYFKYYANLNGGESLTNLQLQTGESISSLYSYLGSNYGFGAQQAFLGYQGFIIDPAANYNENSNRNYVSLIPTGGNYYQENYIQSNGYNGKLSFNSSGQYKDKLYFGINLNSHFVDYSQTTRFYEENSNNLLSGVQRLQFDNELTTYGNGFSIQLGAIAKVTKEVRFGLAYESPTWYQLNDELSQGLAVVNADALGELPIDYVNPKIINVYKPYQLQTPGKWTGSFAYIYEKTGLLSIDYSLKDYSNTQFTPKDDFRNANREMSNLLGLSSELRIGAEYRIKELSLRAGYRTEQSPYKNGKTIGDLRGFSTGFGYNFGGSKLDLTYSHIQRDSQKQFFNVGMTDHANINTRANNITITLSFEL
ncbi:MAG: transporter [Flavobacteriaceae bacterium]|nr:transporter [Flavobacteriaceae bacterium]